LGRGGNHLFGSILLKGLGCQGFVYAVDATSVA